MSAAFRIELTDIAGQDAVYNAGSISEFMFVKERYTPFTYFRCTLTERGAARDICEIRLYHGNVLLHRGTADKAEYSFDRNVGRLRLVSYGYTKQLGQDFAEPGILSNPDLDTIVSGAGIYGVSCQQNTSTVRYVYFDEKTTLWNAVCIYTMKAYADYPFIRGANTVVCFPPADRETFILPPGDMVRICRGQQLGNVFSDVYTHDLDHQWVYHLSSSFAAAHHVTRKKYYPSDREWVYDLNDELKYHMYFSDRAREYKKAVFKGYRGEDLCDLAALTEGNVTNTYEIDGVTIRATPKGIFTELAIYSDAYCNNAQT